MAYLAIKTRIYDKLSAITSIQEVSDNPMVEFTGYPAAIIVPATGASDYETNKEDMRIYAFDVFIYYDTKVSGISTAIDSLFSVVDEVLDSFASDKTFLTPTPITLLSGETMMTVQPVFAGWSQLADKELLEAKISINVYLSIDTT